MAVDVTLKAVSSGYNTNTINENFEALATALNDALSRSGTLPNSMSADLDMNGNAILNAGVTLNSKIISLENVGGTANAITADPESGVSSTDLKIVYFIPTSTNTGATTLSIDGGDPVSVLSLNGEELAGGEIVGGGIVILVDDGDDWRLLYTSAYLDAAEAAQDAAEEAQEGAETAQAAAELAEAGAENAQASAEAAASASGDVTFYDTYSDANSAVGGHSNGDIIEVVADENYDDYRSRYKVESSALTFLFLFHTESVETIADMTAIPEAGLTAGRSIIVTDPARGGMFKVLSGDPAANSLAEDDGTIFESDGGNYTFQRIYRGSVHAVWFDESDNFAVDAQTAVEAAIAAAPNGEVILPSGSVVIGTGDITVQNCTLRGTVGRDSVTPYGASGTVVETTQTDNPVFLCGRGAQFYDFQMYWPDQDGSSITDTSSYPSFTGAPIVYPPAFKSVDVGGTSAMVFDNLVIVNAYDVFSFGNSSYPTGRILMGKIEAFCLNKFMHVENAASTIQIVKLLLSPAVFQSVALVGDQELGKWAQYNSVAFTLSDVDGIYVDNFVVYGCRTGIVCDTYNNSQWQFTNGQFDSTPKALEVLDDGYINNATLLNVKFYAQDRYDYSETLPVITLDNNGTVTGDPMVEFIGCKLQYAQGQLFKKTATDAHESVTWNGGRIAAWAQAATVPAFDIEGAGKILITGTHVSNTANLGSTGANFVECSSGSARITITGCFLDSCGFVVNASAYLSLILDDCQSANTKTNRVLSVPGGSVPLFNGRNNNWDKPTLAAQGLGFSARCTTAQVFDSGVATTVQFSDEDFDHTTDYDDSTYTYTAPLSGLYMVSSQVLGVPDTAGDRFLIQIIQAGSVSKELRGTETAAAENVTSGAISLSTNGLLRLTAGDTVVCKVSRAYGTGDLTLTTNGANATFSAVYVG